MAIRSISTGAVAFLLTASVAFAAPCNTGASKGKTPDGSAGANSSAADKSSKNEAGGAQPASPGTVGAMNNAGANPGTGSGTTTFQQDAKSDGKEDPGAKNEAGGNQPASPGTVGAMNNTGANQGSGKDDC